MTTHTHEDMNHGYGADDPIDQIHMHLGAAYASLHMVSLALNNPDNTPAGWLAEEALMGIGRMLQEARNQADRLHEEQREAPARGNRPSAEVLDVATAYEKAPAWQREAVRKVLGTVKGTQEAAA